MRCKIKNLSYNKVLVIQKIIYYLAVSMAITKNSIFFPLLSFSFNDAKM